MYFKVFKYNINSEIVPGPRVLENGKSLKVKFILPLNLTILIFIIFSASLFPVEFYSTTFVLTGAFLFVMSNCRIKITCLTYIIPLILLFIIGLTGINGHESRHILRDIIYALTPIALFYIGYWMAEHDIKWSQIIKVLVLAAIIVAVNHLLKYIINPGLLKSGINNIRATAVNTNINVIVLSLVFGLFQYRLQLGEFFPKFLPRTIVLALLFLSFLLAFSRTGLLTLMIMAASTLGIIGKANLRSILTLLILISGFAAIVTSTPPDDIESFRGKIARSAKEIAVSDYTNLADINNNWRGFETYKTLSTYYSGNFVEKIAGQGFGALVDLGFVMNLAGTDFSEIPIMHNGYAYVIFKTGLIGFVCYIVFYFIILKSSLKNAKTTSKEKDSNLKLLLGFTLCLMVSMLVVGGMAEAHDSEYVLLIGFAIGQIGKY